jgi:hypothetical protein
VGLPCLFRAAKLNKRLAAGFLRSESSADAVIDMHRDVAFQFGCKLAVSSPESEEAN